MTFIEIIVFAVVCSIAKKLIEVFPLAFPVMMIAAYFFFSGGSFWVATGIATSTLLGAPRSDEDTLILLNGYPKLNMEYGIYFDIIGTICIIVGLIKVF